MAEAGHTLNSIILNCSEMCDTYLFSKQKGELTVCPYVTFLSHTLCDLVARMDEVTDRVKRPETARNQVKQKSNFDSVKSECKSNMWM